MGYNDFGIITHRHANNFNSRTPCGVQLELNNVDNTHDNFNSRTPCGVQQESDVTNSKNAAISTHVPRVGYNATAGEYGAATADFNSRTPCGVQQLQQEIAEQLQQISTHVPRVGYN